MSRKRERRRGTERRESERESERARERRDSCSVSARRSYLALCGHIHRRGGLCLEREREEEGQREERASERASERERDVIVVQCLLVAPTLLCADTYIEEEAYI